MQRAPTRRQPPFMPLAEPRPLTLPPNPLPFPLLFPPPPPRNCPLRTSCLSPTAPPPPHPSLSLVMWIREFIAILLPEDWMCLMRVSVWCFYLGRNWFSHSFRRSAR